MPSQGNTRLTARLWDAHVYAGILPLEQEPAPRVWGWHIALIISEDIKEAIESEGLSGVRFIEV